jgi:filamentous hemagglutinin
VQDTSFVTKSAGIIEVGEALLPGEGRVGTFRELDTLRRKGDHLTPNHVPQKAYMKQYGIKANEGMAIMMEQPTPGKGGRHRQTRTYGKHPDLSENPRTELAKDLQDLRQIYKKDGLYKEALPSLQELGKKTQEAFPDIFSKKE